MTNSVQPVEYIFVAVLSDWIYQMAHLSFRALSSCIAACFLTLSMISCGGVSSSSTNGTQQAKLLITSSSLPSGDVGVAYSSALAASGGTPPYSWSVASGQLPPGLSLASSGTVSGTPTGSGQDTFTAQVKDSSTPAQTANSQLTLTVNAGTGTLQVQVSGVTATQAILTYTAPSTSACSLQVSENSSLSPLVHDIDPTLFSGSNSDGGGATNRFWVVGKRTINVAAGGTNYSRALQADSTHYYKLSCGTQSASGSFTTMNIPNGNTFAELDLWNNTSRSSSMVTVPETRGFSFIDPMTGTLLRRISLRADGASPTWIHSLYSGGFMENCAPVLSNGGYHCFVMGNATGMLYWISPTDGSSRFLGLTYVGTPGWIPGTEGMPVSPTDPNTFFTIEPVGVNNVPHLFSWVYDGSDTDLPPGSSWSSHATGTDLTPTTDLNTMVNAFDSGFTLGAFSCGNIYGVQGNYVLMACVGYQQESPSWLVALNVSNPTAGNITVQAATSTYAHADTSRWCGYHSGFYLGESTGSHKWTYDSLGNASSTSAGGPPQVTLGSNIGATDTAITVSGEPYMVFGLGPTHSVHFLQNAAVGDVLQFQDAGNEVVQITGKSSSTSLTIARGCHWIGNYTGTGTSVPTCDGTGAVSHSSGADIWSVCADYEAAGVSAVPGANYWWDFIDDPHGTDTTSTTWVRDHYIGGGHRASREPYDLIEGYSLRNGSTVGSAWSTAYFKTPPDYDVTPTFVFDGLGSSISPYERHESLYAASLGYFTDSPPFGGGGNDTVTQVATYIYLYNFAVSHPFNANILPYWGTSANIRLQDISGPGSILVNDNATNHQYQMCVVTNAGECWAGSQPGQVYANLPSFYGTPGSTPACYGTEVFSYVLSKSDFCVYHTTPGGQTINQWALDGYISANQIGAGQFGEPIYNFAPSRTLVSTALFGPARLIFSDGTVPNGNMAESLPDGSWVMLELRSPWSITAYNEVYVAKVPPQPPTDGIDRTNFEKVPITVGNPGGSVVAAQVKYGYAENGPPASFFCTQRPEPCIQTVSLGQAIEPSLGVPQRVLFYQVDYLDSKGNVVSSDPVTAVAIP